MFRKFVSLAAAVLLLISAGPCGYAQDVSGPGPAGAQAAVRLDGIETGMRAYIRGETVYLPVRALCEALGYTVGWSGSSGARTVTAAGNGKAVSLNLDSQQITNGDHTYYSYDGTNVSGDSIVLLDGQAYLESAFFSENFGVRAAYDAQAGTVKVNRVAENPISIATAKLGTEDENFVLNLQYPQIGGLGDPEVQSRINAVFSGAASAAAGEGLANTYDIIEAKREYPDYTAQCATDLNYRVTYNQNGLLGVVLYDYEYSGGAHGGTVQTSYVFDLSTGKDLKLSDLMKSGSSYVPYINAAVRAGIDERVASGDLVEFDGGRFETIGDDPGFYLTSDSAVFYFQQYEYFPYAAGIQEFKISYAELADMLQDGFAFLNEEPVVLESGTRNAVGTGNLAFAVLPGNPTTGFTWHFKIEDESVLAPASEDYVADSAQIGAGGTYSWGFRALKTGRTTVTFQYYRDWEGEASVRAENTAVYEVVVK